MERQQQISRLLHACGIWSAVKVDLCFQAAGRRNLEEASSQLHNPLWWEKAWLSISLAPPSEAIWPAAKDS